MPAYLKEPSGLPTATTILDEEAWSSLVQTQLEDTRKSAENWRNGLAAVIVLISGFSVIKGPSDVTALQGRWPEVVGVVLGAALVAAVAGAYVSLKAAYGEPHKLTRQHVQDLGGVTGLKHKLAKESAAQLQWARMATLISIGLLALAVAITWYGPTAVSTNLILERSNEPDVCGKLVVSEDGYVDLRQTDGETVRTPLRDVLSIQDVSKCP